MLSGSWILASLAFYLSLVNGHPTDEAPSRQDVQDDFNRMRREFGIKSISTKWVKRKYAFGADSVPEGESDYLKVVYEFHGVLEMLFLAIDSLNLT